MFSYVIHKLWNKKWMTVSLIIGNVLLIGLVSGNLVYSDAALNRVLVKDITNTMKDTGSYPMQLAIEIRMDKTRSDISVAKKVKELEQLIGKLPDDMGLKVKNLITGYYIRSNYLFAPTDKESGAYILDLAFMSGMEEHSTILSGNMYSNRIVDGAIEVIVSRKTLMQQNLMLGDELYLADVRDPAGNPYKIRVAGVFQNSDDKDSYWVKSPDSFSQQFYMDEQLFRTMFINYNNPQYKWNSSWNVLLSYDNIKSRQIDHLLSSLERFSNEIDRIDCYYYKEYFGNLLKEFQITQNRLQNILFLLEVPIIILLVIFIFMVNNQMMLLERGDIAVLKSRGASNVNIILIYLYQGLIIGLTGFLSGIPLGLLFCHMLGNTNAFLEFVSRAALPVELTAKTIVASLLCIILSLSITLLLAFLHTRDTIVSYKRKLNKKNQKTVLWSLLAGAVLIITALYSLHSFHRQSELFEQSITGEAGIDPLLFCGSILFVMGSAFLLQGLFPFLVKLIFRVGKSIWTPSAYAALQKVIKGSDNQNFILLFLILTVSLGIFDATLARTINGNEEDRMIYSTGADLVFQEKWVSNEDDLQSYITTLKAIGQDIDRDSLDVFYIEPDFNRYTQLAGVKEATKVLVKEDMQVTVNTGRIKSALMGIQTREFGEVAYFKTKLLDKHWYYYLNELADKPNGILVSSNYRDMYGYKVGDTMTYSDSIGSATGIICGFVDYWPTYRPVKKERTSDGLIKDINQFLIVANLSQVQSIWGITPYQVWMKVNGSTSFIYKFADENKLQFKSFRDLSANMIDKNNNPFFQGTNGMLTLGFIVILLICGTGFLIFWVLSIVSRTLQFGVFRAMGMALHQIIGMLAIEQLLLSIIPIALGLIVGNYTAKLYVPLIQLAYSSSEQIIPLEVFEQQSDQLRVILIVSLVIVICMAIIGKLISDMKITQALKLGED